MKRNDKCFCGSGNKYKKCCIFRETFKGKLLFDNAVLEEVYYLDVFQDIDEMVVEQSGLTKELVTKYTDKVDAIQLQLEKYNAETPIPYKFMLSIDALYSDELCPHYIIDDEGYIQYTNDYHNDTKKYDALLSDIYDNQLAELEKLLYYLKNNSNE